MDPTPHPAEDTNRPSLVRAEQARRRVAPFEQRALGVLAVGAVVAIGCFVLPLGVGVLLGWLFACGLHHVYREASKKTGHETLYAFGFTAGATLVVGATLTVLGYLLVVRGALLFEMLPDVLSPTGGVSRSLNLLTKPLAPVGVDGNELLAQLRHAAGGMAQGFASFAAEVVEMVFDAFLALFFMSITTFFLLRNWNAFTHRAERLLPLNPHHTRALLRELKRLGRQTIFGTVTTGIVQGVLAGLGYFFCGVPDAGFFGAMTAVASLLPGFGTMLVWVPAASWLVVTGHPTAGACLFAWGAIGVVAFPDYVLRPRLVGKDRMSLWMTFIALFGGIKLFGVVGLLLGPVIVGIALAALRIYERERQFRLRAS
jgi:predicted PurR-regulated permease PerM